MQGSIVTQHRPFLPGQWVSQYFEELGTGYSAALVKRNEEFPRVSVPVQLARALELSR